MDIFLEDPHFTGIRTIHADAFLQAFGPVIDGQDPPVFPTPCRVNKEQFFYPLSRLYTENESICREFSIRVYIISCGKESQTENGCHFGPFSGPIPGPVRGDSRSD